MPEIQHGGMPVGVRCPACHHAFTAVASAAGKLACPGCGRSLRLPPAMDPADPLIGRTIGGFQLVKRLGSGAMAAVYEGRSLGDGSRVAVKMLTGQAAKDEETVVRFRREADLARSLTHPHVVGVAGNGTENGVHWIALELVTGTSLEAEIDRRGPLPWREAVTLVLQVGEALAHLGGRGVLHRDVKPANILITSEGVAKLSDLGFAKSLQPGVAETNAAELTMAGMAMGSPAYMAPEQVMDAKAVTHAADVYGLGATLYHAVTGVTPFAGRNPYEVMQKVMREPPPPPRSHVPDLPLALTTFLVWTLEKDPTRRPPDAAAFISALNAVVASPDAVPKNVPTATGPRLFLALVATAGVAVAAAVWWWVRAR